MFNPGSAVHDRAFPLRHPQQVALWILALMLTTLLVQSAFQAETSRSSEPFALSHQLPLSFVPNVGQSAPPVQFQARGLGGSLFFTEAGVTLTLPSDDAGQPATVALRFEGANPEPTLISGAELPGKAHYLLGNDPAQWRTGLPTYEGVIYEQLYNGVDLHFEGTDGTLKGTYLVAAGADPAPIRWRYEGATAVQVEPATGELLVWLAGTDTPLREHAPVAWQEVNGQRVPVAVHYALAPDGTVSFALPAGYNATLPLILDPTLTYSTYLGATGSDNGYDVVVDEAGNAIVIGYTGSADFPIVNPLQGSLGGSTDVFVSKLNADGSALLWSTFLGGNGSEYGTGIARDETGALYLTGSTSSPNFPTLNPLQANPAGSTDAFITKLSADGGTLLYSTYLGGASPENTPIGTGDIAVDGAGHIYVAGNTASENFPVSPGALFPSCDLPTNPNGYCDGDAFVSKLVPDGSAFVYSTYLGGENQERGYGIAVDEGGSAVAVGWTLSSNFPVANAIQPNIGAPGNYDAFVTKLAADGSALGWSTYLGGSGSDYGYDVAMDTAGKAYVTGSTGSNNFPTTPGAYMETGQPGDAFVTAFAADGSAFAYSTYFGGGNGGETAYALAVDQLDQVAVAGETASTNLPVMNPLQPTLAGAQDAFLAQLDATGSTLLYGSYLGGSNGDVALGVALDPAGTDAFLTGRTTSPDFPTSEGAFQPTIGSTTAEDGWVARVGELNVPTSVTVGALEAYSAGTPWLPAAALFVLGAVGVMARARRRK